MSSGIHNTWDLQSLFYFVSSIWDMSSLSENFQAALDLIKAETWYIMLSSADHTLPGYNLPSYSTMHQSLILMSLLVLAVAASTLSVCFTVAPLITSRWWALDMPWTAGAFLKTWSSLRDVFLSTISSSYILITQSWTRHQLQQQQMLQYKTWLPCVFWLQPRPVVW